MISETWSLFTPFPFENVPPVAPMEQVATFTHQWEPRGARLFFAGGSLYYGGNCTFATLLHCTLIPINNPSTPSSPAIQCQHAWGLKHRSAP